MRAEFEFTRKTMDIRSTGTCKGEYIYLVSKLVKVFLAVLTPRSDHVSILFISFLKRRIRHTCTLHPSSLIVPTATRWGFEGMRVGWTLHHIEALTIELHLTLNIVSRTLISTAKQVNILGNELREKPF